MAFVDTVGVADSVLLHEVSEDAFVANLKARYDAQRIFTYIGEVLIAVNPYEDLGNTGTDVLHSFRGKRIYQKEPHVFALAESAYSTMRRTTKDCVVIISGESGAGKTEASKQVMRYVAGVNTSISAQAEIVRVRNQLLASNPLLEAFGNAKTIRNDNSSRFGKYMDINFDYKAEPVGGHISNYLLEKARVVQQGAGERNFHIFYQLLAGADDTLLAQLDLQRDAAAYAYLKQGRVPAAVAADRAEFAETIKAMTDVGLDAATRETLQRIVAAVLHLGELQFAAQGDSCTIANPGALASAAKLLGSDVAALDKALTTRTVAAHGEIYETKLTAEAASHARQALAKSVYERLFSWLVKKINASIAPKTTGDSVVLGVLDIYGFEIFPSNSFEQFCINYCNEKLQQVFIELVLKREQEEYEREGIDWVHIEFFNNAELCAMIDDPRTGMIAILDEQCALASGSDKAFLAHLDRSLKDHARYSSKQLAATDADCERERDFRVRHFAGDVVYSTAGFVEKNNDTLFHDLKRMLYQCDSAALKEMWPEGADPLTAVHKIPFTAATNFRISMDKLVSILTVKEPFYIRCIKPNGDKASRSWDDRLCRHQVAYLGLMENLRVRRAGYCNRQPYEVFVDRYKMLCKETWPHWHKDPKDGTRLIVKALGLSADVAFGKTKLFIKEPSTLGKLEQARDDMIPLLVAKIQAFYRGVLARRRVRRIRAVYKIIAYWYAANARRYMAELCARFEGVAARPDLGKGVAFPTPPAGLGPFAVSVRRIHSAWRLRAMLARFTPEQQAELKQKVLASDLLAGRRPYWGFQYKWEGNYIARGPDASKFGAAIGPLMEKHGDSKVFFSSRIFKLNHKGKQDERVLVITDKHAYRLHPKTYKLHKHPLPLSDLKGFSISEGEDQAVVFHFNSDNDLVAVLRGNACAAELVSLVAVATNTTPHVEVDAKVHYHAHGKDQHLSFSEEGTSRTGFTRRNSGYALVTRKASIMRLKQAAGGGGGSSQSSLPAVRE